MVGFAVNRVVTVAAHAEPGQPRHVQLAAAVEVDDLELVVTDGDDIALNPHAVTRRRVEQEDVEHPGRMALPAEPEVPHLDAVTERQDIRARVVLHHLIKPVAALEIVGVAIRTALDRVVSSTAHELLRTGSCDEVITERRA